jgi:hypothetical protein
MLAQAVRAPGRIHEFQKMLICFLSFRNLHENIGHLDFVGLSTSTPSLHLSAVDVIC